MLSGKNISRPQLSFKDKIDNSNAPFIPLIKEKPNSIKPLAITLEKDRDKEEYVLLSVYIFNHNFAVVTPVYGFIKAYEIAFMCTKQDALYELV